MLKKHKVSAGKNSYRLQVNVVTKRDWEVQKYNFNMNYVFSTIFHYISITNVKFNHFLWYSIIDAEAFFLLLSALETLRNSKFPERTRMMSFSM